MKNQALEPPVNVVRSITRRMPRKPSGLGLALLVGLSAAISSRNGASLAAPWCTPTVSANSESMTSTMQDAAGDAVFPYDLYGAPVPAFLDLVKASITASRGTFRFELQMNALVPANADPGFTPGVNHLGPTFALLTDPATAESPMHFFGHNENYMFNYLVGALYSVADSGVGLEPGWRGFFIDLGTLSAVEIPLKIRKDTLIVELPADLLGNPETIDWLAVTECDPVVIPEEKRKGALLLDYVPEEGYATWTAR